VFAAPQQILKYPHHDADREVFLMGAYA